MSTTVPRPLPRPALVLAVALLALGLVVTELPAREVEVLLSLPQRARLDLTDKETVTVAPFLVVSREGQETGPARNIDIEAEFERYLLKLLRRQTDLDVVEMGPVDYPLFDLAELIEREDLWRELGERSQADLIVSGSLDFDIRDRSGYRTQQFVSPLDGRTYYRQVLIEQTGFEYDILMYVFDGETGEVLYEDNFKDFQSFQSDVADPLSGMFENLRALEGRILGIFTQKEVQTTRVLFVD